MTKLKVLDLCSRLPGPLAAKYFVDKGASVTKLETKEDPFKKSSRKIFNDWYHTINKDKSIVTDTDETFDIIIAPYKVDTSKYKTKVLIKISSNQKNTPLHDLGALSKSLAYKDFGDYKLPFLPLMGVLFASQIYSEALWGLLEYKGIKVEKNVFLSDVARKSFDVLASKNPPVHTGNYPCYNIYQLKDKSFVSLSALEPYYWEKFCETFKISLHSTDPFDTTINTYNTVQDTLGAFSKDDLKDILAENNFCLEQI
ncbi:MAG: CoA transferase [Bacteriovoracaceae bacterium]|jgi:hypothetical protein|nr:CoA transferase [Bacteriovoracaceae bacterium]